MKRSGWLSWMRNFDFYNISQGFNGVFFEGKYPYPEAWFDYCTKDFVPHPKCGHTTVIETVKENCTAQVKHPERPWPDILRNPEDMVWAVSDRVVASMEAAGITGYRLHPLKLIGVPRKYRPTVNYWILEVVGGGVAFEPVLPEQLEKCRCSICGDFELDTMMNALGTKFVAFNEYLVDTISYGGDDWAVVKFFGTRLSPACTSRIVELAHRDGWTNAFFGVFPTVLCKELKVDYYASNWRNLLMYDLDRRDGELSLVDILQYQSIDIADHDIRKKVKEMKARGELIMPTPRPEPIYDLHQPPVFDPVSEHLFDNLGASDGTAWQSSCDLLSTFGPGDLIICVDEDNESDDAEDVPTKSQRRLYDFFVANQERLLPMLHRAIVHFLGDFAKLPPTEEPDDQALMAEMVKIATAVSGTATFVELKPWLEKPFVEIGSANARGRGTVGVSYSIVGTSIVLNVELACNPAKQEMVVKEIDYEVI